MINAQLPKKNPLRFLKYRFYIVCALLLLLSLAVLARMVYLTVIDQNFLAHEGDIRTLRVVDIPAYRGMILDRNHYPLAVSIPTDDVWMNPQDFPNQASAIAAVRHILRLPYGALDHVLLKNKHRYFVYLKRGVKPEVGAAIEKLNLPGIYVEPQYQRTYPTGSVTAQVIGFTNIDDEGVAGLELAYDQWLEGIPGKKQILQDRYGEEIAVVSKMREAKPGHDLVLSIDHRIQYIADHVLAKTIEDNQAEAGSVIVMNPKTGEILAMSNQPTFDPNLPHDPPYGRYRNRAVTDMFEPGSTMKAFSIANALESGQYTPDTMIQTAPGWMYLGNNRVRDELNYGDLTVRQVLQHSSNMGVAKMTLALGPDHFLAILHNVGFGQRTASGFPGESPGMFPHHDQWRPFVLATLAFGYGITVTPLQLAQAYSIIANHGELCPVTFIAQTDPVTCSQVMNPRTSAEMLQLLESVLQQGGTGTRAVVPGYLIAGKTGTAYIATAHGYDHHRINASFVGIAPVSDPQLVVAVVIRDPKVHDEGATVAAPAFSEIMAQSLRILDIPPDQLTGVRSSSG